MKYSFVNFNKATVADWSRCEIPERKPDYISFSGSAYWDYGNRVRRLSDHWGIVRSCKWLLEGHYCNMFCAAECYYDDFRSMLCLLEIEDGSPREKD